MKGKLNKIFSVFMLTLIIGQISVPFASNVSLLADEISVVEKVNDNIITEENTSDEKVESETSFEETQSTENEEKVTEEQNAPPVTEEQNVPPVTDEVEVIDDVESLETAIEEDEEVAVTTNEIFSDYVDSDENTLEYVEVPNDRSVGNTYTVSKFAHPSITIDDYSATRFGQLMYYKIDGTIVFCIEPTKDVFSSATEQSESASSWSDLTSGNKREIGWIISYGLENYDESGNDDYLYATQLLIWDEIDPDKYDLSVQNSLTSDIETIQNDVSKHTIVPSFTSTSSTPTHTLTWNGSSYSKTLTDTNGVWDAKYAKYGTFGDYTLSDPTGANNVKVSTTNDNASTYNYTATYNPYNSGEARFFDANQDLVNVGADPVDSYMKFEIEPALGKIMISKTGESLNEVNNSNIPLSGVKFEIIDSSGKVVETVTTDTNGKVISSDLMLGNYQICEVDAPTGYILSSCKDVTVSPNETASVKIINDHIEGSMKLNKIGDRDYQSNETGVALDGVVFTLSQDVDYNGSYETTVETLETNVDGEIFAKNLDYGNYQVCETDSVEGYLNAGYCEKFEIRTQNQQVNVNGNEPIVNEVIIGGIHLTKNGENLDETNDSDVLLTGTEFMITGKTNPDYQETVVTDENGEISVNGLTYGIYTIEEVTPTAGYLNDGFEETFEIDQDGEVIEINNGEIINNAHIEGSMKLSKIGDQDYQSNETGVALDGVEFTLSQDVDYNGSYETTVETLSTNVDGEIFAKNLDYGNYQVCETNSVEGYLNTGYCEKFEIRTQNQQVNINGNEPIVNEVIIGGIHLTKNGENLDETNDSDVLLAGTEFMVTGKTNPDYQETFVTDENGEIAVEGLTYGIYTIEEVTPTVGYLNDGFEETFEIDQDGEVIEINNGEVINNDHIEGSMKLSKIGETVEDADTWKTLKDVEFTLSQDIDYDGSYETEVGLYYTDNNGEIVIDNLDYGNYQIVETDTNQMYFNDGYTEEFIIVEDGVTVEINGGNPVYNYLIKGKIEINKAGENFDNTDETIYPLDGAEFTIYRDNPLMGTKDVKDIFDIAFQTVITDEVGYAQTSDLLVGTYFIEETKAPAGYILDETVHTVVLNEDTVAVNYDVYPINNGEKVINDVIMGQLEVYKNGQSNYVNEGKEYPLSEVEYSIYQDLNCNQVIDENESTPVDVIVTDDNGYAITTDLKYGNYIIKETNAPENYAIYEGQYYAAVTTDGEIIDITNGDPFVNHLEEAPINIVKTDDYGNPLVGVEFTVLNGDYTAEKLLNNETELGAGMISPMPMIPEVVGTYVTDENGEITTDLLPYGTYTVIETKGLGGYYVNIDFNVIEINDETVNDYEYLTLDIENKLYNPEIKIKKVDSAGNPLSGAEFAVYQDTNTDGVLDEEDTLVTEKFVSDSDGYVTFKFTEEFKMTDIYGTPYGYFVVETKAPVGYVLETEPQYVSFGYADYDGDYQPDEVILNPSVEEDDFTTYWLEPTEALVDEYEFENELIENEIHVKKTDMATGKEIAGAEIAVYDSEGELYESWTSTTQEHVFTAEYGNYTMCEEIAPEGYERLTQCVKFDVTEEGVIQYLEIENELIKNEVLITGNKVIYIIAGISVTISTIYIIKRKFLTN